MIEQMIPEVLSDLRQELVTVPDVVKTCSGIRIYGRKIRSILFTTDVAIIANHTADAVLAVYPFTPSPAILKSIMLVASVPVLAGVGGGLTRGIRSANMSLFSESEGATAVVVNGPTNVETIEKIDQVVDVPIIYTMVSEKADLASRLAAGVDIVNISCGPDTSRVVAQVRSAYPELPIIATGGPTEETIAQVIAAGANAVTITPPSNAEIFKKKMAKYRQAKGE